MALMKTRQVLTYKSFNSHFIKSYEYTQRRHGMIRDFFTSKLSFGYKIRGIKSRENFKPKGTLIYKAKYRPEFRYLVISSGALASVFTGLALWDFFDPVQGLAQSYLVNFVGVIVLWLLPSFIFPSTARRLITRIWVDNTWWVHIETHSKMGKLKYIRLPLGFVRLPEKQLEQSPTGLRKYVYGVKIYNEWGFYYLRRSGRFIDEKGLSVVFGERVVERLDAQELIQPVRLPPIIMDNNIFPPTKTKHLYDLEREKIQNSALELDEPFMSKLNVYGRVKKWYKKMKKKELYLKQIENGIIKANKMDVFEYENGTLGDGLEEWNDYRDSKNILGNMEMFSVDKNPIYKQFPDLDKFSKREVSMMKEYDQIGMVSTQQTTTSKDKRSDDDNETKKDIPVRNDIIMDRNDNIDSALVRASKAIPEWIENPELKAKKRSKGRGGRDSVTKDEYRVLILGKPKYERDKRTSEYIMKYGLKCKPKTKTRQIKKGYVMSTYAIDKKIEEEGGGKDEIDRKTYPFDRKRRRCVGMKKFKRFIYNHWRPRRFAKRRWVTWHKERVVFEKIKPKGRSRNRYKKSI